MNETRLNRVIAEWMGWEESVLKGTWRTPGQAQQNIALLGHKNGPWSFGEGGPPDYCQDLNAIASAEAKLSDIEYNRYCACLHLICNDDYHELKKGQHFSADPISATALQRATALAKALNLYIEP